MSCYLQPRAATARSTAMSALSAPDQVPNSVASAEHEKHELASTATPKRSGPKHRRKEESCTRLRHSSPVSLPRPRPRLRQRVPCFWHAAPNSVACPQWPGLLGADRGRPC